MKIFFLCCLTFALADSFAQKKIKTISLSDTIAYTAVDRPGDFYVITATAQIQRFNKQGKLTLLYKGRDLPTVFDPRDGARLFAYYRKDQHYEFLNPSFETTASYKMDPAFAIQPWLICPSAEYKLWVLDSADNSLKKINVKASSVELEVTVDPAIIENATAFSNIREYQSFVFLLNPLKGIYIFNNLGKHIKTISEPGILHFNFLGEELYYLKGDTIKFFNLFSAETRDVKIHPGYSDALLTDERMMLFKSESIDIFEFRP
jgi:hypothetical protein